MIPLGREAVTLFHRVETIDEAGRTKLSWRRIWLDGCFWRHAARYSLSNAREVVCRVPAEQQRPGIGDVMVLGHVNDAPQSALELCAVLDRYRQNGGAFRVKAVNDNVRRGFPLAHYAARGE